MKQIIEGNRMDAMQAEFSAWEKAQSWGYAGGKEKVVQLLDKYFSDQEQNVLVDVYGGVTHILHHIVRAYK